MIFKLFKKEIRSILPESLYRLLAKIYKGIFPEKRILDISMVTHNEEIFQKLKINLDDLKTTLNNNNIQYQDCFTSWHYHLFAGINDIFKQKNLTVKNILEIGTDKGDFANFLSRIYSESQIYTIDLPDDDPIFNAGYGREDKSYKKRFLNERKNNLMASNINFIKLNSTTLLNKFSDIKFDIIWIDGDHYNPQVTIDIMNSLQLAHEQSVICVDDICIENYKENYVSNESYLTLENLEKNKILENHFIYKRVFSNQNPIRYVSCSFFKKF
jgi:hypothetical protein